MGIAVAKMVVLCCLSTVSDAPGRVCSALIDEARIIDLTRSRCPERFAAPETMFSPNGGTKFWMFLGKDTSSDLFVRYISSHLITD